MKLSKRMSEVVSKLQEDGDWHIKIAARKAAKDPTLPSWFDKPAEYYTGLSWGKYSSLEAILHAYKAYNGYTTTDIGNGFETCDYFMYD